MSISKHAPIEKKIAILSKDEEQIDLTYEEYSKTSFRAFYRGLKVETARGPRVFENVAAPFQIDFFEDIADPVEASRSGDPPGLRRFWLERTKKGSKDADLAVIVLWLMAFPLRPYYAQVGAANREQAGIVKERLSHLLHFNPWLNKYVEVIQSTVKSKATLKNGNPMAHLDIMAADAAGAHGGTPDLMLINELSHIRKWEFAETLMDNADGVPQGLVIIATNAGFKGSKAEVWRKNAIKEKSWCVHVLERPAPWHSKETIEDARRRNITSRFNRLWRGKWVSGIGDAISEENIDRAFRLNGPLMVPRVGMEYCAGLDLGVTHDHAGLVVLEIDFKHQKVATAYWQRWKPDPETKEVDLIDVENRCKELSKIYRISYLFYDPHQAKLMAQRLKRAGVMCIEMSFSVPSNLVRMANSFVQLSDAGKLELYDDEDGSLRQDIGKFNIVEKNYGHRLEAVSDEYGHADVGTAMIIAMPHAMDAMNGITLFQPDDAVANNDTEPLTEEEVESMPQELREIYEEDFVPSADEDEDFSLGDLE